MKSPHSIVDHEPERPVYEFSVVAFKKTDASRNAYKGTTGTVVDLFNCEKHGYQVETDSGDLHFFKRCEFRLATPEDLAKVREVFAKRTARALKREGHESTPPEMPKGWPETK